MVTLGKKASLHARRTALSVLRQKDAVKKLFDDIAPRSASRNGGYTRIIKLGQRKSDSAPLAFLEWVDDPEVKEEAPTDKKAKKDKKSSKAEARTEADSKPAKEARKSAPNEDKKEE
jgi:large subunit ribosomal protein L17